MHTEHVMFIKSVLVVLINKVNINMNNAVYKATAFQLNVVFVFDEMKLSTVHANELEILCECD
jgi:hypothetical protein